MYAKVFDQIFDSSIAEDYTVRHVFMDLLVLADSDGVVDMTLKAISRRINVPLDIVESAVKVLCDEDTASRTKDHGGRRLVLLDDHRDWGWRIVNYHHYREIRDEEGRRSFMRQYMREKRASERKAAEPSNPQNVADVNTCKLPLTPVNSCKLSVAPVNSGKLVLANAEAEAEAEGEGEGESEAIRRKHVDLSVNPPTLGDCIAAAQTVGIPRKDVEKFYAHFDSVGWIDPHKRPIRSLPSALAKWKANESNHRRSSPTSGSVVLSCN